jgi:Pyruvate/2-oxoacid:ferredoxin oxidoreductase delta subunit
MNIFKVIAGNLKRHPLTLRFPERVTPPAGLRGLVRFDPDRCVGCATCAYVCPADAIKLTDDSTHYEWAYQPGRCTFCGRCVDVCPTQALTMEADRPPIYTQPGVLRRAYRLPFPRCPECGRPAHPINDVVLSRAFAEITNEVRTWSRLCSRCRQHRYQPALIETGYATRSKGDER